MTGEAPERLRWQDAMREANRLTAGSRRVLLLLAHLPLLSVSVLAALDGLKGPASLYRTLDGLAKAGLVAALTPALQPRRSPGLYYLTDLGLATIAVDQGRDLGSLVRRNRLGGEDLLALVPGLRQLVATYELLGALARSRLGQTDLLAWERPWWRRFQRPTAKQPVTVEVPAYAALSWDGVGAGGYLLLPDRATFPLYAWRGMLFGLLALRSVQGGSLPPLVIAATGKARAEAWRYLLREVCEARGEAPLMAGIAAWDDLPDGLARASELAPSADSLVSSLVRRPRIPPLDVRRLGGPLPRRAGSGLSRVAGSGSATARLGRVALGITPADRDLLDLVGRHPYLSAEELGAILGWSPEWARERRNTLVRQGLLRFVEAEEVGEGQARRKLVELTRAGLELVAAQQGLRLAAAVRFNGLAGGGPAESIGARRSLVGRFEHTLGVNRILTSLYRTASQSRASCGDDALLEWRNAVACSRGALRPDGYGLYRRGGRAFGFFLEYDRGTMKAHAYADKFAAYYAYRDSNRFERDYLGFPTILVVAVDRAAEERVARAARAAAVGREPALRALFTIEWRVYRDPGNPEGLLGLIWRWSDDESTGERRRPFGTSAQ